MFPDGLWCFSCYTGLVRGNKNAGENGFSSEKTDGFVIQSKSYPDTLFSVWVHLVLNLDLRLSHAGIDWEAAYPCLRLKTHSFTHSRDLLQTHEYNSIHIAVSNNCMVAYARPLAVLFKEIVTQNGKPNTALKAVCDLFTSVSHCKDIFWISEFPVPLMCRLDYIFQLTVRYTSQHCFSTNFFSIHTPQSL